MQAVKKFIDRSRISRGIVPQYIFLDPRAQSRRESRDIQRSRVGRPCQEALRAGENQSVDLLLIFAQTQSQLVPN